MYSENLLMAMRNDFEIGIYLCVQSENMLISL